jgi:hypothetical protein
VQRGGVMRIIVRLNLGTAVQQKVDHIRIAVERRGYQRFF